MDDLVARVMGRLQSQVTDTTAAAQPPKNVAKLSYKITGSTAATPIPITTNPATLRLFTGPPSTVNKNFLSRTVSALENQNKLARETQMWSEREADKKYDEVTRNQRKRGRGFLESSTSMSVEDERAYWAAQKAAVQQAKFEEPTTDVADTSVPLPVVSAETRADRSSRSSSSTSSSESKSRSRHRHRHHRTRDETTRKKHRKRRKSRRKSRSRSRYRHRSRSRSSSRSGSRSSSRRTRSRSTARSLRERTKG